MFTVHLTVDAGKRDNLKAFLEEKNFSISVQDTDKLNVEEVETAGSPVGVLFRKLQEWVIAESTPVDVDFTVEP